MESLSLLIDGFAASLQLQNLFAALIGVTLGTIAGVLPGLGISGTIALLLPISYGMSPLSALIMFSGIYYGAMYGGSITSILVNVPGEGASVVTCLEGYKMARRGRAGAALAAAAIGSFVAGTLGVVGITFFAPPLANAALAFGPPEFFAISLLGLVMLTNLTGKSPLKSFIMMLFGLMIGTIGIDPMTALERFTFGVTNLAKGLDFIVIVMGLFGMGEIIATLCEKAAGVKVEKVKFRDLYPNREETKRSILPIGRGSIIGFFMGLIPGPSATISTFVSYAVEKKQSRHPEEWGTTGAIEGVAGPESANNAASSAQMIPLLSLGLPFTSAAALLLSGFMIHGIQPGPMLVSSQPEIFWGLIASMYIGNLMCLVLNLPLVGIFASLLRVPMNLLMPVVAVITLSGAFVLNYSLFDLYVLVGFGILGYLMQKAGYEPAPLAIGAFLGPQLEQGLMQAMVICEGSVWNMLTRPLAGAMLWLTVLMIVVVVVKRVIFFMRKTQGGH
jgi:putative tricarboxylic transport membrane protein